MADPTASAAPRDEPVRPPDERFGRFVLHRRLGTGGMGDVWLATDTASGDRVALKRIRAELSEEARRRLRLEVEALSRLASPHICAVRDWGNDGGVPWFSMDALEGRPLSDELGDAGGRPLPLPLVRRIATAVTAALGAAHAAQVVHRDLKPENVFLCEDGAVKLLDFGIAKVRDEDSGTSLYGTLGGRGRFTPQYMAPEQVTRKEAIGPATDLYALGVMLFELLAGRLPFVSETAMGYVTQHLGHEPPPLSRHRPGAPRALEDVLRRLLAKRPQDRPASAVALAPELDAALAEAESADADLRLRLTLGAERPPAPLPVEGAPVTSKTRTATAPAPVAPDDPRALEHAAALRSIGDDPAEREKLEQVRRDLERPILREEASPFAFARASGLSAALLERLEGRSLGDALVDMSLSADELDELKELGRGLTASRLAEATRRSGKLVFALAAAREVLFGGAPRDPSTRRGLADLVAGVRDKGYVTSRYRSVLDRAFTRLSGGDGGRG